MNLPLDEKLATILHELWHIGPRFDGDVRRHPGRCYAHTPREAEYHAAMHELKDRWLAQHPSAWEVPPGQRRAIRRTARSMRRLGLRPPLRRRRVRLARANVAG